jgi:tRNA(Arg) A34 adenosine deaminase TadA
MDKNQAKIDEKFMGEAIKEAEIAAREGNWAMGAVVVWGGKIIGRGHNEGYTRKNRLEHAEILALENAREQLEIHRHEATMYTTYEPCPMCIGALLVYKIKRLVTGIDLDESGGTKLLSYLPPFYQQEKFKISITRGVLPDECKAVYFKGKPAQKHSEQYNLR